MRYGFYETPAEREIDAAYTSERDRERELNALNDQPRHRCENAAHTYGYDCPVCTAAWELAEFYEAVAAGEVLIDRPALTELAPLPIYTVYLPCPF